MKCFLHIGTEKTATTSIQDFLDLNRVKLQENNYIYTESAGKVNNKKLAVAAYDLSRRDNLTKKLGINTDQELYSFQQNVIEKLEQELSNSSNSSVIFSSEYIQSRLRQPSELLRLKSILKRLGFDDISIIVYLRNPVDTANSLYSTAVKCGETSALPPLPNHKYYQNICHHQQTLERFGSVFGESALIPKIFHKSEFKNGSIINDFLATIGIHNSAGYKIPQNKNESLSPLGIEILRRINAKISYSAQDNLAPPRKHIVRYFEKYFSDGKYIMPQEMFEKYELAFKESNEWVRKNFFGEKERLFAEKKPASDSNIAISEQELNVIANMIIDIWQCKLIANNMQ